MCVCVCVCVTERERKRERGRERETVGEESTGDKNLSKTCTMFYGHFTSHYLT